MSRWSRRKLDKEKPADAPDAEPALPADAPSSATGEGAAVDAAGPATHEPEPLPPVESLTPESDFKPFMRADVDPSVKNAALKQMFKDPHFNVMDGLDTYIDDYSIADPIPEEMMKKLYQARELLFSPEEKAAADAADAADAAAAAAQADVAQAPAAAADPGAKDT
ncbi:MAG: DUF3306 domain-containing protein [Betaproteobacteria bacterium]